jgi:hypothetical protein
VVARSLQLEVDKDRHQALRIRQLYPWEAPPPEGPPAWQQLRLRGLLAPCLARGLLAPRRPRAPPDLGAAARRGGAHRYRPRDAGDARVTRATIAAFLLALKWKPFVPQWSSASHFSYGQRRSRRACVEGAGAYACTVAVLQSRP